MNRRSSDELAALDREDRHALQQSAEHARSRKIELLRQNGFAQLLFPTGTQAQLEEYRRVERVITDSCIDSHIIPDADGMLVYVKPEDIALLQVRDDVRTVIGGQGESAPG